MIKTLKQHTTLGRLTIGSDCLVNDVNLASPVTRTTKLVDHLKGVLGGTAEGPRTGLPS